MKMQQWIPLTVFITCATIGATAGFGAEKSAQATWDKTCAKCHGKDGVPTRIGAKLGAVDYTDPKVQASFTDAEAVMKIKDGVEKDGRKKMKAYGKKLSDEEIKALVQYLRDFKKS